MQDILKSCQVNLKDMHWPELKIAETWGCFLEENSVGFQSDLPLRAGLSPTLGRVFCRQILEKPRGCPQPAWVT